MLSNFKKHKRVYYVTDKQQDFSSVYLNVRKKEDRIYADEVVKYLPSVSENHRYYMEWKLRQKSTNRIVKYLSAKNQNLKIMDLGCGNGWFSYQLSLIPNSEVYGVDVNDEELEQAARVFEKTNLHFLYADIFAKETDVLKDFDIITVNSCIQYFQNIESIISRLKEKLNTNGELHILDSPFYESSEIPAAKQRTKAYYRTLGVPEMAHHYFHQKLKDLKNHEILYKPSNSIIKKIMRIQENPFYWIKIVK